MGSLFKTPKPPKLEPPTPIADPDDPNIEAARRRRLAKSQRANGMQSAQMADGARETLG